MLYFRNPSDAEPFVSNVLMRTNSTPYQWLPTASSLTNTLDLSLRYMNSSLYNITNASGTHEFTIWLDNRNLPADIPLFDNVGGTTLPPNPMIGLVIDVPQGADLFVNVMHFVNRSLLQTNLSNGTILETEEIVNNMYYSGMKKFDSYTVYRQCIYSIYLKWPIYL